MVEEREHLHRERLVDLEQADVVDGEPGAGQGLLGGGDRADAHDGRVDPGEGVADQPHARGEAELVGGAGLGEQAGGRAVVEAGRVARGHPAVRAERGPQLGQVLHGGAGAGRLVGGGQAPAALGVAGGHGHQALLHLAGLVGGGELGLAGDGVGVGPLLGDVREAVVEVLRGRAHDQGRGVDDLLGDEARVGVHALAHRVVAHVLDPAGDGDVVRAEADARGRRGHRGHRARAHPVDGEARDGAGEPGQQGGGPPDRQPLVPGLRGGGHGDLVDALRRQAGVALEQAADAAHDHVVRAGLGVHALVPGLAEGGADAVDEDDISDGGGHGASRVGLRARVLTGVADLCYSTSN